MNEVYGVMALLPRATVVIYNYRPGEHELADYAKEFKDYMQDGTNCVAVKFGSWDDLESEFEITDEAKCIGRAIYYRKPKLLSPIYYVGQIAVTQRSIPISVLTTYKVYPEFPMLGKPIHVISRHKRS